MRYPCNECGLFYMPAGGPGSFQLHPSHVCEDGQRYLTVYVCPLKFERRSGNIVCTAFYKFGPNGSRMNSTYECLVASSDGTVEQNLDNAEISALLGLLKAVEDDIIPARQAMVLDTVHTNSPLFAARAWMFRLIVGTPLNEAVLDFLLNAPTLKYSPKREAFVKTTLGWITKSYPASAARRQLTVQFIQRVKRLAMLGIQVYWMPLEQSDSTKNAKAAFSDQPLPYQPPQNEIPQMINDDSEPLLPGEVLISIQESLIADFSKLLTLPDSRKSA
ncbi:hypothetical protein F4779DRAFT_639799 [Xylariaceae sp. FL0662B]|nr:hypothetical protein F4779DRAFT_639799 [Xylariaceae sp. FL0662B]